MMERTANISPCGQYRYSLTRNWDTTLATCSFGMINPSTADADIDDATIRKCIGFAKRMGYGGFTVWNAFAYRATKVRDMVQAEDPVGGIANDDAIRAALDSNVTHFVAWGPVKKVPKRLRGRFTEVLDMVHLEGFDLHSIGTTKCGSPRHPLMTAYATQPEIYIHGIRPD